MKRAIILTITAVAALLFAVGLRAEPTFSVMPPRNASVGRAFAVTFRLDDGQGSGLQVGRINGCELLRNEPSVSTSQSYQIINGVSKSNTRVEYTYHYRANAEGEYTIPPASIVVDGKKLTTKPVKFTVSSAQAAAVPAQQRPTTVYDPNTQTSDRKVNASDVFVRINLNKSSVYEQEAIECTIKLYTTYSIEQFMVTRQPEFEGCLIQELDNRAALNQQETINGRQYLTAVLKKCILFPQRSGKLTINSGNYDLTVIQYETVNMGGFFNVRQPVERQIKVTSNTASFDVKPLPQPQPEGFFGAVGRFTINSRLVGNTFRTNDPATLMYTIEGTGNIKYLEEPEIDFPSEFELYAPKSDIDAHVSGNNVTGKMTIEYTFVPQSVGKFRIGSDKFVYFDPSKKEYVTLNTPPYEINVARGTSAAVSADQEAISSKNKDILHIVTVHDALSSVHSPVIGRVWYWMLYVAGAALLIAALVVYRRNIRRASDVASVKLAKAGKIARRRLAVARKFMVAGQSDRFYSETLKAFSGYLGDKLGVETSQLSRPVIEERLRAKNAAEDLLVEVNNVLDACEMASYTPNSDRNISQVYDQVTQAIGRIENLKTK